MAPDMQGVRDAPERSEAPSDQNASDNNPVKGREGESTNMLSDGIANIYDIPSDAALELLCFNIENLEKSTTEVPADPLVPATSVGVKCRDNTSHGGDTMPIRIAELYTSPAADENIGRGLVQLSVLSKRFVSKREPPISLRDYLLRLHKYCPMSTAVYLGTSVYFTKMAVVERILSVNPKNMHRLVLAGLRVAMKALEDLSYPHSRVARVGGVSERELSKIEISFCFLVDFKLRVDGQMLLDEARALIRSCMSCGTIWPANYEAN